MRINLHIERLVLDGIGITANESHLLEINVTSELTRMLNDGGLAPALAQGAYLARLPTSRVELDGSKPLELGRQIAQSLYGGIGHE